jgi:hypothetical protein
VHITLAWRHTATRLDASPGINLIRSFAGAGPPEDLRLKKP